MPAYKTIKLITCNSLLICSLAILLSSTDGTNYRPWDVNNKLTWADFKDTLITNSHRAAATNSGIRVDFTQTSEGSLSIHVYSAMFPARSWVDSTRKTAYILSHEQYHFNITEYWSRKMKKDLSAARFTANNAKQKVEAIRKEDFGQCHDMQMEYDADTKHSEIEPEQKRWEKKVDELLKSVEGFSAPAIDVKLK